jgi:hypothetical protein
MSQGSTRGGGTVDTDMFKNYCIELLCDIVISFLDTYPKELKIGFKQICMPMFITAYSPHSFFFFTLGFELKAFCSLYQPPALFALLLFFR